jgi:hypothetical protein
MGWLVVSRCIETNNSTNEVCIGPWERRRPGEKSQIDIGYRITGHGNMGHGALVILRPSRCCGRRRLLYLGWEERKLPGGIDERGSGLIGLGQGAA